MKVIDPGHLYELDMLDVNPTEFPWQQTLQFVKRIGPGYPGNEGKPEAGTNCQEVIRVLIDRVKYLNGQIPSEYNDNILFGLRYALNAFEARAAERHGRNWNVTRAKYAEQHIEHWPTCPHCGHIDCEGACARPHSSA